MRSRGHGHTNQKTTPYQQPSHVFFIVLDWPRIPSQPLYHACQLSSPAQVSLQVIMKCLCKANYRLCCWPRANILGLLVMSPLLNMSIWNSSHCESSILLQRVDIILKGLYIHLNHHQKRQIFYHLIRSNVGKKIEFRGTLWNLMLYIVHTVEKSIRVTHQCMRILLITIFRISIYMDIRYFFIYRSSS
jgi:hypothetical protein